MPIWNRWTTLKKTFNNIAGNISDVSGREYLQLVVTLEIIVFCFGAIQVSIFVVFDFLHREHRYASLETKAPIAEGMFGIIYQGILVLDGCSIDVVLKAAKIAEDETTFKMLLQELNILIHTGDHTNIVKFYGVTSDARFKYNLCILNEFCSMGNLDEFLNEHREKFGFSARRPSKVSISKTNGQNHQSNSLEMKDLLRFVSQICSGMCHLASKKVIHGDLAARNILLTENLTVKITDFGMSRRLYNYQVYSQLDEIQAFLPWRWMSIEAIEDLKLSEKSDVWSYGVLIWEIFTFGDLPYSDSNWVSHFPQQLRDGLRLPQPGFANPEMYEIMQDCWKIEATQRPTFEDLKSRIKKSFEPSGQLINYLALD